MPAQRPPDRWFRPVLDFVLPPICLGCRDPDPTGDLVLGLCPECLRKLTPVAGGFCDGCGRDLAAIDLPLGYLCGRCRLDPPPWRALMCGWSYAPPFDRVVHGLKFGRLDFLGGHLARALHSRFGADLAPIDIVTPVPLHWRRRIARGYNQAEEIARPLAGRLDRPFRRLLRRVRATQPQSTLSRVDRAENLRKAFRPVPFRVPVSPAGPAHVLLVDDVVTTGATLRAAARCLLEKGARDVTALTAGRTLHDRR